MDTEKRLNRIESLGHIKQMVDTAYRSIRNNEKLGAVLNLISTNLCVVYDQNRLKAFILLSLVLFLISEKNVQMVIQE